MKPLLPLLAAAALLACTLPGPLGAQEAKRAAEMVAEADPPKSSDAEQERDKGLITNFIETRLSGLSREVRIDGFEGALSSEATIARLSVSDREGEWLVMENLILQWNRSALFRGRVDVDRLGAGRIAILRPPVPDREAPQAEATPLKLPDLPLSVEIEELAADEIALGPDFLGEPVTAEVYGDISLKSGALDTTVTAVRLDDRTGQFLVQLALDEGEEFLAFTLLADEEEDGIAARLLNLPGRPAVRLEVSGQDPIDDFTAKVALDTDGEPRLQGTFQLAKTTGEADTTGQRIALDLGGDISPLFFPAYRDFFGNDVRLRAIGHSRPEGGFALDDLLLDAEALRLTGGLDIGTDGWPRAFSLEGSVGAGDGNPVLLPLTGPRTQVGRIGINVSYDAAVSPDWTADVTMTEFARPGGRIPETTITGGGQIVPPAQGRQGHWDLALDYAARGIETLDAGLAQALGDAITGRVQAEGAEGTPTQLPVITLTGPGVELTGNATVQGGAAGYHTRAEARFDISEAGRFSGLVGRALAGSAGVDITLDAQPMAADYTVTVKGDTQDLALGLGDYDKLLAGTGVIDIRARRDATGTRLPDFYIQTDAASIEAEATLTSEQTEGFLIAQIPDATILSPDLKGSAQITSSVHTQEDTGHIIVDLSAGLPAASMRIGAEISERQDGGPHADLDTQVRIDDLALYSDLLGRDLNGAITADIDGWLDPESEAFDITVDGETQSLALGVKQLDALLQGDGKLDLSVARDADGAVDLRRLDVETGALTATGTGRLANGGIEAAFDANLPDTSLLSPDLSGPMRLIGKAMRNTDGSTDAVLSATGPGTDIALEATVAPPSDDPAQSLATRYDIDAKLDDLSRWSDLADRPLRGSATARVTGTAKPNADAFDARIDATSEDLQTGIPLADALLVGRGRLTARAARSTSGALMLEGLDFATPRASAKGDLRFEPGNVAADLAARIENVTYLAPGLNGPATLTIRSASADDGRTRVLLEGSGPASTLDGTLIVDDSDPALPGDFTVEARLAQLSSFRAVVGQPISGAVDLNAEGRTRIAEGSFTADISARTQSLAIGQDAADNVLRGTGRITGTVAREADGTFSAAPVSVEFPNFRASGSGSMTPDGTVEGDFTAVLPDMTALSDQLSGTLTASGTARRTASGTQVDARATGPGGLQASALGTVLPDGRLRMKLTGDAPLALANEAIEPRALQGTANFDLAVNGPAELSSLSGVLRVDGARLAAPIIGEALTDITGQARISGNTLQLDLGAAAPAGGGLRVTGDVVLTGALPAELTVQAEALTLKDPLLYETTANGRINVTGPLDGGARIAGRIELARTELRVPSSASGALGELPEIHHIRPDADVVRTLERAGLTLAGIDVTRGGNAASGAGARPVSRYPLDLTIAAPARIFVRGRGLDAELGGSLHLSGDTEDIIPSGRFELIRGRISILQQRFELTEGYATLEGDFSPYLRLVATTQTPDGSASIILDGDADAPEIHFKSTPELPEDEVLSRLIFGRDLSSITPLQAVQLAAAVNTLAGRGNGGLIGQLRDSVGLDDLDITSDDKGNTALRAGKYLSENVYSNVTVNSDGSSRIDLNLDMTDDVTVRGGAGSDGSSSVGVYYERDY